MTDELEALLRDLREHLSFRDTQSNEDLLALADVLGGHLPEMYKRHQKKILPLAIWKEAEELYGLEAAKRLPSSYNLVKDGDGWDMTATWDNGGYGQGSSVALSLTRLCLEMPAPLRFRTTYQSPIRKTFSGTVCMLQCLI